MDLQNVITTALRQVPTTQLYLAINFMDHYTYVELGNYDFSRLCANCGFICVDIIGVSILVSNILGLCLKFKLVVIY